MDPSAPQDDLMSPPAKSNLPFLPNELIQIIFNIVLRDHPVQWHCIIWPIYWETECDGNGNESIVPYVKIDRGAPIRRVDPYPLLRVCKWARALALDPAKALFAVLPVLHSAERVVVHPNRDVFAFHALPEPEPPAEPMSLYLQLRPRDLLQERIDMIYSTIAYRVQAEIPPYGVDPVLLQAAVVRHGFNFRHVLFPSAFEIQTDTPHTAPIRTWVLVHLCTNTDLRAHQSIVLFPAPMNGPPPPPPLPPQKPILASSIIHLTSGRGYVPSRPMSAQVDGDEGRVCVCDAWPGRKPLYTPAPPPGYRLHIGFLLK